MFNRISTTQNLIQFKRKEAIFQNLKLAEIRKKFEEFPESGHKTTPKKCEKILEDLQERNRESQKTTPCQMTLQ